jgi:hypothetical protein
MLQIETPDACVQIPRTGQDWGFLELQMVTEACLKVPFLMSNSAVWEDSMVAPFGRRTVNGARDFILFKHGALTKRKWPVHTESTIAVSCCSRRGGLRQNLKVNILFKVVSLEHHSLLS